MTSFFSCWLSVFSVIFYIFYYTAGFFWTIRPMWNTLSFNLSPEWTKLIIFRCLFSNFYMSLNLFIFSIIYYLICWFTLKLLKFNLYASENHFFFCNQIKIRFYTFSIYLRQLFEVHSPDTTCSRYRKVLGVILWLLIHILRTT